MAKKPDQTEPDEQPFPQEQEVTLTFSQLLELVRAGAQQGTLDAEMVATLAAKAAASATATVTNQDVNDFSRDPRKSVFNPLGERDHQNPSLKGDIYWAGYLLKGDELTRQEIELTNQLKPGHYEIQSRSGGMLPFTVTNLDPGSKDVRRLLVLFPCMTADQRYELPTMVEMLNQVLPVATAA